MVVVPTRLCLPVWVWVWTKHSQCLSISQENGDILDDVTDSQANPLICNILAGNTLLLNTAL